METSPATLSEKIDQNNRDWLRSWGCSVTQRGQAAICTNPNYDDFNVVFAIDCDTCDPAILVRQLRAEIRRQAGHDATVEVTELSKPGNLPRVLAALGLDHSFTSWVLHQRTEDVNIGPTKLSIQQVTRHEDLLKWVDVYCRAFGRENSMTKEIERWNYAQQTEPVLRFYLGRYDGVPVVTGQLILSRGVAGLYSLGTVPEARNMGFAAEMIHNRTRVAKAGGLEDVYLVAESEENKKFFKKLGFSEVLTIWTYTTRDWPNASAEHNRSQGRANSMSQSARNPFQRGYAGESGSMARLLGRRQRHGTCS